MKERILVVGKEGIGHPDPLGKVTGQGDAGGGGQVAVGQSFVRPVLI